MRTKFLVGYLTLTALLPAEQENSLNHKFYAFQNGMPQLTYEDETAMLKSLGFDGISQVKNGGSSLQQRIEVYRKQGLDVLSLYPDAATIPIEPKTYSALGKSGGMIELTVHKMYPNTAKLIRQTAAEAESHDVRIALYPHHGFAVATMPQALKLANEVNHPNLGVMFNLCHFLKNESENDLEVILQQSAPHLFSVSTCGADRQGNDWSTLIQTLDRGSFPQERLLKALHKIGYDGPVTLQCYNIKGDKKTNLQQSAATWKKLVEGNR